MSATPATPPEAGATEFAPKAWGSRKAREPERTGLEPPSQKSSASARTPPFPPVPRGVAEDDQWLLFSFAHSVRDVLDPFPLLRFSDDKRLYSGHFEGFGMGRESGRAWGER